MRTKGLDLATQPELRITTFMSCIPNLVSRQRHETHILYALARLYPWDQIRDRAQRTKPCRFGATARSGRGVVYAYS